MSPRAVGIACLAVGHEVADIVGMGVGLEGEGLVERGCFLLVCRLLVGLAREVVIEERGEIEKLNDREASIGYHSSKQ